MSLQPSAGSHGGILPAVTAALAAAAHGGAPSAQADSSVKSMGATPPGMWQVVQRASTIGRMSRWKVTSGLAGEAPLQAAMKVRARAVCSDFM